MTKRGELKNISKVIEGILHVKLKSSVLREELTYEKLKIIKLINAELGKEYIKDLVIS